MPDETVSSSRVARALREAGCPVAGEAAATLAAFLNVLARWNRVFNLTGVRRADELIGRHLVESLALAPLVVGESIVDVGSGAGLPGLPLAAVEPGRRFTLIESRAKRCAFLRHAAAELGLANVTVVEARAEDVAAEPPYDTVLARAVAKPAALLELCRPLTRRGGRLLLLTSPGLADEYAAAAGAEFTRVAAPAGPAIKSAVVVLDRRA